MTTPAWCQAGRVLAVRLDGMGDLLMTSPAIRALARQAGTVDVLVSPAASPAARLMPGVGKVTVYEAPWMKASPAPVDGAGERTMARDLQRRGYAAAVIFTVYSQNPLPAALLCHMADIPLRLAHCRENPYHLLSHWVPDLDTAEATRHEVRRQLDLVATLGCTTEDERLHLRVPEAASRAIAAALDSYGMAATDAMVVIHPGASAPSRRYPAEGFTSAARLLAAQGCRVVFTGGPAEVDLVEGIRGAMHSPSISFAGKLDLGGLAALLYRADVLVSNNSGPVHVAAALGTPVVDLYAQTNPQHTPWGVPNRVLFHDVACRWCYKSICPEGHHNCLRLVPASRVAEAVLELLHVAPVVNTAIAGEWPA